MNKQIEQEVRALRAQGIPEEAIAAFIQMKTMSQTQQTPMSQSDTVVIPSRERDVSGVYITEYQKQADAYGQMKEMMDEQARLQTARAELSPPQAMMNPNYRVETEGQHVTVGPQGQIIHY